MSSSQLKLLRHPFRDQVRLDFLYPESITGYVKANEKRLNLKIYNYFT